MANNDQPTSPQYDLMSNDELADLIAEGSGPDVVGKSDGVFDEREVTDHSEHGQAVWERESLQEPDSLMGSPVRTRLSRIFK